MVGEGVGAISAAFARVVQAAPPEVVEAVAALHRAVHDEVGLEDLLHRAVEAAVHWLPSVDFAGITVQFDGAPFTAAGSDPRVLVVDELQYELGDGPCLTAMRTQRVLSVGAAQVAARWPVFAADARAHGVVSYLAAPLVAGEGVRGCFNLYGRGEDGFAGIEADFVAVLGGYVSRGLIDFTALRAARELATQLRQAMDGRAPIEQAKGILMAVHQITDAAAFNLLRVQSQTANMKLRDVAAAFVATQARQPLAAPEVARDPVRQLTGVELAGASGALDFQSAFDHAPIGMALADPHGVLLTVNPALARLLGGTLDGLVGTTLFDATHPDDLAAAYTACAGLRDGTESTAVLGVRLRNTTGGWTPVIVSTSKVLAGDGRAAHLVMHIEDVTDHPNLTK